MIRTSQLSRLRPVTGDDVFIARLGLGERHGTFTDYLLPLHERAETEHQMSSRRFCAQPDAGLSP